MNTENPFKNLSDEQLQVLHTSSETFEQAQRSGDAAPIEQFLNAVDLSLRPALLSELLAIELEWRVVRGESPSDTDYISRFPTWQDIVEQALQDFSKTGSASDPKMHDRRTSGDRRKSTDRRRSAGGRASGPVDRRWTAGLPMAGTIVDGRYTIIKAIGEGGMGSVFLAEQHEPVVREVAIKFIKGGMDSKAVMARFDVERQSLARMDHPGIARVYDGGANESGFPYFVMELVRGIPVTHYCDEQRLDVRTRLHLFLAICQAVQHAHLKGIIHRDLKPGNILITAVDGTPVPKVIDFGVAKAIDLQPVDAGEAASVAMILGTPAYMSPEQADPSLMDIDTRTDVFSLGVVLYELLVGSTPSVASDQEHSPLHELLRRLHDTATPRPSLRVGTSDSLTAIAAKRSIDTDKLVPLLRGELDWITLKAIEKDRSRRYETVSELARDIERYLSGEMVEARPPSHAYRLQKFVTRYRRHVIASGLLLVTLTAGVVGTTLGLMQARKHERAAQQELTARTAALENEARERRYAEAITEFVEHDFLALTSLEGRLDNDDIPSTLDKDSTLRELLDRAREKLSLRKDLDPRTEARLQSIIGRSYVNLGAYPQAIPSLERALQLSLEVYGRDQLLTLQSQRCLAGALLSNGQHELSRTLLQELLVRSPATNNGHLDESLIAKRLLAKNYRMTGDPNAAVILLEETLAAERTLHGSKGHATLTNMYELALALNANDHADKAITLLEETSALQTEVFGIGHPDTQATLGKLAELYSKTGQFRKAQPLLEQSLEWSQANYGMEDHHTIFAMTRLAAVHRDLREMDRAVPLAEQALELTRKAFADNHPNIANAQSDLAMVYRANGDHAKALRLFEESLDRRRIQFGDKHSGTLAAMMNVASGLKGVGQFEKSQDMNEQCLKLALEIVGDSHSYTITIKQNLAAGYWSMKRLDRSVPLFEDVLAAWITKVGRSHPSSLLAMANVGVNYRDAGRLDEGIPLLEEVWAAAPDHPSLGFVGMELFDAYRQAGRNENALLLQTTLLAEARTTNPPQSLKLASPLATIGRILLRTEASTEAEPLLREAMMIRQQLEPDAWRTFDSAAMLAESLLAQQKPADAEPLLAIAIEGMLAASATGRTELRRQSEVVLELVELLKTLDRPDEAAAWSDRFSPISPEQSTVPDR